MARWPFVRRTRPDCAVRAYRPTFGGVLLRFKNSALSCLAKQQIIQSVENRHRSTCEVQSVDMSILWEAATKCVNFSTHFRFVSRSSSKRLFRRHFTFKSPRTAKTAELHALQLYSNRKVTSGGDKCSGGQKCRASNQILYRPTSLSDSQSQRWP